ncbi:unnamed protein product [Linum trigynum]|uniref:Zinc finger protein CONSTANS-LIKE 16 n=1 Tax=Linum trigynum TaxID=586398 RepID=A0AAV2F3D3_9ROSI
MNKSHSQQQVAAAAASAYGGKTARACDSCIRRRARWYCAADDAFLCQSCDASVHSANPLARRHERLRLKTASLKSLSLPSDDGGGGGESNSLLQQPAWHRGFTRKARTPRANGSSKTTSSPSVSKSNHFEETLTMMRVPLVPEIGCDDHDDEEAAAAAEEEHQLLYRVPILDPLELCNADESFLHLHHHHHQHTAVSASSSGGGGDSSNQEESLLQMQGLVLPSDMELAEFAADVESLLGRGLEAESFGMEELGILDCSNHHNDNNNNNKDGDDGDVSKLVKMETGEFLSGGGGGGVDEYSDEQPLFQLSFDYGGDEEAATCQEEDEKMVMRLTAGVEEEEGDHSVGVGGADEVGDNMEIGNKKRKRSILLRLNYEAVMAAWDTSTQGSTSPWTNGRRPEFDVNECWPDCMGGCGREYQHHLLGYQLGEGRSLGAAAAAAGDGGREARVSRYREKRRTRLFSKKIRYEVRKLNAEKRPRMKGRFVKRASFAAAAASSSTTSVPNYTSLVLNKK